MTRSQGEKPPSGKGEPAREETGILPVDHDDPLPLPAEGPGGGPATATSLPQPGPGSSGPSAPPSPRAFEPGQLVADRYDIVGFIAEGAMGEVYEARDRALQTTVALKTVRAAVAAEERALKRFTREIQVARSVTHPNVCRIFDLGWHRPVGGPEVMFLTMELLRGETLSQRIRRGPLDVHEALPIVEQMAAGLDAAHAAGVIHRDFKSANVMLVPSPDPRRPVRAVVSDFGLARSYEPGDPSASITESGMVSGTPAYMAPEQVQGAPLTPSADVYALGIVIYEMVTGIRPFDGGSAMTVAVKRLTEPPAPPRRHRTDLPERWEAVILRCLEREPARRPASAGEVARALSGTAPLAAVEPAPTGTISSSASPVAVVSQPAGTRRRASLVAGGAALLAVLLAGGYFALRPAPVASPGGSGAPAAAVPVKARRTVAVLGVINAGGQADAAWLETAIADMLTVDLGVDGKVRTVPGHEVAAARADLGLEVADALDAGALQKVRSRLAADVMVLGSYTVSGEGQNRLVRVDLKMQDTTSGQVLATARASGTEGQLFDLVGRAGAALREKLGIGALSAADTLRLERILPANREAARHYAEGVTWLRRLDAQKARDALRQAVQLDPKHALSHAALASAYRALGNDAEARAAAARAAPLAADLPADQKLLVEAAMHEANGDWGKAAAAYRTLFETFPDDVEHGIRLADALTAGGKAKEAVVVVESLRGLPAGPSDPRIDLSLAAAQWKLADYAGQLKTAESAAKKALALGAPGLAARAHVLESSAHRYLGDAAKAYAAADKARAAFEPAGDQTGVGRALETMALALYAQGELDGARRLFERALETHRAAGNELSVARVLHNLGNIHLDLGQSAAAERSYDSAFAAFRRLGARSQMATAMNDAGVRFHNRGQLAAAQRRYREALAVRTELGERNSIAMTIGNLAEVLMITADLGPAEDMFEEALALHREIGAREDQAYDLVRLADIAAARGDLRVARERYDQALQIQLTDGDRVAAAATRSSIARVEIVEGRAAAAEALAREAEEVLRSEKHAEGEVGANLSLAAALLAQGRNAEARDAATRARTVADRAGYARQSAAAAAILASALVAEGRASEAIEIVNRVLPSASKAPFVAEAFELRIALAAADKHAGKSSGATRLREIAGQAAAKDLHLIARRAKALAESRSPS